MPLFSIIIVTHNSSESITPCLQSLLSRSADSRPYEVIIVDNASTDSTRAIVRSQYEHALLVENRINEGFSAGVNIGFAHSSGEFLLIVNPDANVQPDFLSRLTEYIERTPQASIIGCRLLGDDGRPQSSSWGTPGLRTLFLESLLPYELSLLLIAESPNSSREVEMVSGACMAVRRKAFEQLSGFDLRFFMYYEDADLCLRAREAGLKIYFCHEASVVHQLRKEPEAYSASFFENLYASRIFFFHKHFSRTYSAIARFMIITGIIIRIPAYLVAGALLFNKRLLRLAKYHTLVLRKILRWM
jgi:GT2 family glycosyltransferase